ncbi:MAG: YqaA family protein [Pseudomonadota bacterium]
MKLFATMYDKCMTAAEHKNAPTVLSALSFAESSFFPIPPDVMLAPMAMRVPHRAFWFAFLTTVFSVLGGIAGYAIGFFAFDYISSWLQTTHYWESYLHARDWFEEWGVWVIFVAGFSPIPYKLFTITAGVMMQPLLPFIIASFIGRGSRFFLVAGLLKYVGAKIEPMLMKYIEWLGWLTVGLLAVVIIWVSLT